MEWVRVHPSKLSFHLLGLLKILRHVANCDHICFCNLVFDKVRFEHETEALLPWRYSINFPAGSFMNLAGVNRPFLKINEKHDWHEPKWLTGIFIGYYESSTKNTLKCARKFTSTKPENWSSDIVSHPKIWSSALQKSYFSKVWKRSVSDCDVYIWSKPV